ncbi:uncharacterized protein EV422DRAFT_396926 [Fimicolochytrium jonesii]|uniref:uncharacterized protein n=1 Tax=Fimicolochytrium jonesii TaxID=1396493 RepID=UPI0022FE55F8|nr:uncharacterized protein EV422DRAFT_396926 [Fimicolochytrium jonesii]KAI8822394.1 hypothetical protein EV422DRAFT_396926 [Fimicolochytrium jonesii]
MRFLRTRTRADLFLAFVRRCAGTKATWGLADNLIGGRWDVDKEFPWTCRRPAHADESKEAAGKSAISFISLSDRRPYARSIPFEHELRRYDDAFAAAIFDAGVLSSFSQRARRQRWIHEGGK